LGDLISRGISQSDLNQVAVGALIISLMAICADLGLGLAQRKAALRER